MWKYKNDDVVYLSKYEKHYKKRMFILESYLTTSQVRCYFSSPVQAMKEGWRKL